MKMNHHTRPPRPGPECASFAALLALTGQERLDPRDSSDLRAHLATCVYCQTELDAYHLLDSALQRHFGAPARPPLSRSDIARLMSDDEQMPARRSTPAASATLQRDEHPNSRIPRPGPPERPHQSQRRRAVIISCISAAAAVLVIALVVAALFASGGHALTGYQKTPEPTQRVAPTTTFLVSSPTNTATITPPCSSHSAPAGIPGTPGAIVTPVPLANWQGYTNTIYHYTLKFPANWGADNIACPDTGSVMFWNYDYGKWNQPGFPAGGVKIELDAQDNPSGLSAMDFFTQQEQAEQQNEGAAACPAYTTQAVTVSGHSAVEAICSARNTDTFYIPDGAVMLSIFQAGPPDEQPSGVLHQIINSLTFTS